MKNNNYCKTKLLLAIAFGLISVSPRLSAEDASDNRFSLRDKPYWHLDLGVSLQQDLTLRLSDGTRARSTFDPGFRFDLAVGRHFAEQWAGEVELGFLYNPMKTGAGTSLTTDGSNIDFFEFPMMVNVVYTLPLHGPITAYAGAGIGAVYGLFVGSGLSLFDFAADYTFGYQGLAGVNYAINDKWALGVAYKFLGTTDHDFGGAKSGGTRTHSVLATLTLRF